MTVDISNNTNSKSNSTASKKTLKLNHKDQRFNFCEKSMINM